MTRSLFFRRVVVALAVLCLALPAAAYLQRLTIFFSASFDPPGVPNSPPPAEVGQFGVSNVPAEFTVVPGPGGGQLKIEDFGTSTGATLEAQFKKLFKGSDLDLAWKVEAFQTDTTLIVQAGDQGGTGLIDCTLDDDGTVDVGGIDSGFTYATGVVYQMLLTLKDPLAGQSTWTLRITAPDQPVFETSGAFSLSAPLSVNSLSLIRPANQKGGKFLVDDLQATSLSSSIGN